MEDPTTGATIESSMTTMLPPDQQASTSDMSSITSSITINSEWKEQRPSSERRFGYREAQFEKIMSADVVKMVDLRKLGWNGIPVRTYP